jgi:hypothetical protein
LGIVFPFCRRLEFQLTFAGESQPKTSDVAERVRVKHANSLESGPMLNWNQRPWD